MSGKKWQQWLCFLPLISLLIYGLWKSFFFELHDFSNAYFGAVFLKEGSLNSSIYDALHFNQLVLEKGFENQFVAYYPNTPFWAFFFYPWAFFSNPFLAKLSFNALSILLFIAALVRLQKVLDVEPKLLLFIPLIFFITIRNNLYFGQGYFLIFFLLTFGLLSTKNSKSFYWALALVLKVFPVLFALMLLVQKEFKNLFLFVGYVVLFVFVSCLVINVDTWIYYWVDVFPKSVQGAYYDSFTPKAKSATMLFKNLFIEDDLLNPTPFFSSYIAYVLVQIIYKTTIVTTLILHTFKSNKSKEELFGFWVIGAMLLSPGWSSYASILLLFPLLVVWQKDLIINQYKKIFFTILITIYCNIPISYFWELPLLFQFPKVYLLLLIFFSFTWFLSKPIIEFKQQLLVVGVVLFIFGTMGLMSSKPTKNAYVLQEKKELLITDYGIQKGHLWYQCWTIPTSSIKETNIVVTQVDSLGLEIRDNQVYYQGIAKTNDKGLKRKPLLINGKDIYYLSDNNRGVGFYTLLKVELE